LCFIKSSLEVVGRGRGNIEGREERQEAGDQGGGYHNCPGSSSLSLEIKRRSLGRS
jgi:hypothetical protein